MRWLRKKSPVEFGPESIAVLERNVPYYRSLSPAHQARLQGIAADLIARTHWEGCRGFTVTDEMKVTIAGHAACLLLGWEKARFSKLKTILLYPTMFIVEDHVHEPDGTVAEVEDEHAGQSWDLGVVVLAWDEVQLSANRGGDAYNVVLHEFAHQLDAAEEYTDGAPPLEDPALRARWADVMQRHYDKLDRDVRRGRRTVLDPYALEAPAEFFAVATETFFEDPVALRSHHPELYGLLQEYYRQDPASLPED